MTPITSNNRKKIVGHGIICIHDRSVFPIHNIPKMCMSKHLVLPSAKGYDPLSFEDWMQIITLGLQR